jgi:hypothetical protein
MRDMVSHVRQELLQLSNHDANLQLLISISPLCPSVLEKDVARTLTRATMPKVAAAIMREDQ